ncbi:MAG: molybdopterin-dependent oxidoreductase [Thermodesulfobacteriota bacterium]
MIDVTRREFLRLAGLMGGASLFAGCHLFKEPAPVPKFIEGAPGVDPIETLTGIDHMFTVCGMCPGNCGIRCRVAQGTLVKIGGNPYHPVSVETPLPFGTPLEEALTAGGSVCAIGSGGIQHLYDPFRVVRPLKRVGPRGSGKWKALTWQQVAQELITGGDLFREGKVDGLKRIKDAGQGLTFLVGRADWGAMRFLDGFVNAFPGASLSRDRAARLDAAAVEAADAVFGPGSGPVAADYRNARFVLSIGDAPLDSGVPLVSTARGIAQARVEGRSFRWAVVDPRLSVSAAKADFWVPVIPGRDLDLALGIMRALADLGIKAPKLPEQALDACAKASGVSVETIVRLAKLLAEAGGKAAVIPGKSILTQPNGLETTKAVLSLNAMVGSVPGSGGLTARSDDFLAAVGKNLGSAKPGSPQTKSYLNPVKALFTWQADPVYDDPFHAEPFLRDPKNVPLFVAIDTCISETSALADYILPDTTYLERWDICVSPPSVTQPGIGVRRPVVGSFEPVSGKYSPIFPETRPMEEIVGLLAAGLGLPGFEPDKDGNLRTVWSFYRGLLGKVLDSMKSAGLSVPSWTTGVEAVLQRGGIFLGDRPVSLPAGKASQSVPELPKPPGFPDSTAEGLLLITYSLPFHRTAAEAQNSWLLEIVPENRLQINHSDAQRLKIEQHATVIVETLDGKHSATCKALIVPGIKPGVVAMAKGFGYRESGVRAHVIDQATSTTDETRAAGVNLGRLLPGPLPQRVRVRKA